MAKLTVDQLEPADGFRAVLALRSLADALEAEHVASALELDWTWHQIAEALNVTRQAVHKKHRPAAIELDVKWNRSPRP